MAKPTTLMNSDDEEENKEVGGARTEGVELNQKVTNDPQVVIKQPLHLSIPRDGIKYGSLVEELPIPLTSRPTSKDDGTIISSGNFDSSTDATKVSVVGRDEATQNPSDSILGVNPLQVSNGFLVEQVVRGCDVLGWASGFSVDRKFRILNDRGEPVYWAVEKSSVCDKVCLGGMRKLSISINDVTGKSVLVLEREASCIGCCCACFYPSCTSSVQVWHGVNQIGEVRERATWIHPVFHAFSGSSNLQTLKIRGPVFIDWCSDITYDVTNVRGEHVASISKNWLGLCETDLNNKMSIKFFTSQENNSTPLNFEDKSLVLATALLLSIVYYNYDM